MTLIKFNKRDRLLPRNRLISRNRFFPWNNSLKDFLSSDEFFKDDFFSEDSFMPAMNVKEHQNDFEIEFAAPGFSKKDFEVTIKDVKE